MLLRTVAVVPLLLAFALAQEPAPAKPSCCAEASDGPLPPLPADATPKERWLRRLYDEAQADERNIFLSSRYIDRQRQQLAALAADAPLVQRFGARWQLAQALVRIGQLDEAIALLRECVQLCEQNGDVAKGWLPEVLLRLGATHFRQAEKQNCIARHNADSCILPLSPRAVHVDKQGAAAAAEVLERLLALPQSDLRLEAIWLLNIAHMALGDWPDGVPAAHRIDAAVFAAEAPMPRMHERGAELDLAHHNHAGSIVVDDFNGDGRLDVLTCAFDLGKSLRLLRNDGDWHTTDSSESAGLSRQLGGSALVQGDVDGDGLLDVFVVRGGGFFAGSEFPCSLLRQDAPGHFVDVSEAAGVEIAVPARCAAFADVDRDGDLDLFVVPESERTEAGGVRFPTRLFVNDGHGRFTDATATAGLDNPDRAVGAVVADLTGDGLPDLYVSNFLAPNRLFVNRGDGTFRDEAQARGVDGPLASGPCAVLDVDNDGDLDLFVGYQHHYRPIRAVAAWYVEHRVEDDTQRLFVNDGKGHFTDGTEAHGLRRVAVATGVAVGDVDNDGFPDLYLTTGAHDFAALFPNVLLRGGATYADVTFAAGVGHLQKGNGAAIADFDGDGACEIAAQVGGYYPDDAFGNVLFHNPGNGNHWLEVRLRGVRDNRFGIGARVRAHLVAANGERDVWAQVGATGSLGCGPLRAHLGLGRDERLAFVEVHWPAAGTVQRVADVPLDARIAIEQGADGFTREQ